VSTRQGGDGVEGATADFGVGGFVVISSFWYNSIPRGDGKSRDDRYRKRKCRLRELRKRAVRVGSNSDTVPESQTEERSDADECRHGEGRTRNESSPREKKMCAGVLID
jgi:hypothetical protein